MHMENQSNGSKSKVIKSLYFYMVSFVALMMVIFSVANMINIALKTWVFTKADMDYYELSCQMLYPTDVKAPSPDECEKQKEENRKQQENMKVAQKQRDLVRDISMILVGIPLFAIHWRIVRKKDENL